MDREKLVEDNLNLVHFVLINKFGITSRDSNYDDLVSVGNFGLVLAANTYTESKGSFSTYATRCIKNEILLELRKENYKKRKAQKEAISLDEAILEQDDGGSLSLIDMLGDEEVDYSMEETKEQILKEFNEMKFKRKDLYVDYLNGMKSKDISKKYGVSVTTVNRTIHNVEEMLHKKFKDYI